MSQENFPSFKLLLSGICDRDKKKKQFSSLSDDTTNTCVPSGGSYVLSLAAHRALSRQSLMW